jgi:hypothetical protein
MRDALLCAVVLVFGLSLSGCVAIKVIRTPAGAEEMARRAVMPSTYDVTAFGAKGDGKTDDTAAIQNALDAAGKAGGGTVLVPRGVYMIKGHLSIPMAVALQGTWQAPPSHTGIQYPGTPKPEWGSVLLAVEGKGNEDGDPFVLLADNATIKGFVIYYPEQEREKAPYPYPWTIRIRGTNSAVLDMELLNPYKAIDAVTAHRHLIRNIHGQPLRLGIYVDQIYDIGRIENVHFNPWWSGVKGLFDWQMNNGEAFVFGRTDWQYVLNTFCYGYKIGYRFIETEKGACNGNFLGIGADDCLVAIQIDQSFPYGILITNGEFVSFRGADPTMVVVTKTHKGAVRFVNCAYWGPNKQIAKIAGKGTVGFSDCTFQAWDKDKEGRAAIQAESGTVLIRGCEFREDCPQISLGPDVQRAVIVGNVFRGKERIANNSKGAVQIGLNAAQ